MLLHAMDEYNFDLEMFHIKNLLAYHISLLDVNNFSILCIIKTVINTFNVRLYHLDSVYSIKIVLKKKWKMQFIYMVSSV